jgi:hypothetical protein
MILNPWQIKWNGSWEVVFLPVFLGMCLRIYHVLYRVLALILVLVLLFSLAVLSKAILRPWQIKWSGPTMLMKYYIQVRDRAGILN